MAPERRKFQVPDSKGTSITVHTRMHITLVSMANGTSERTQFQIYFEPVKELRKVVIGHIGTHLPTARYPKNKA